MGAMERLGLDLSHIRFSKTEFLPCAAIGGASALVTLVLGAWSRTYPAYQGRSWVRMFVSDLERVTVRRADHSVGRMIKPPGERA